MQCIFVVYPNTTTLARSRVGEAYLGDCRMVYDACGFTLCSLALGDRTGFNPLLLNTGYLYSVVPLEQWRYQRPLARRPVSPRKALLRRCPPNMSLEFRANREMHLVGSTINGN